MAPQRPRPRTGARARRGRGGRVGVEGLKGMDEGGDGTTIASLRGVASNIAGDGGSTGIE